MENFETTKQEFEFITKMYNSNISLIFEVTTPTILFWKKNEYFTVVNKLASGEGISTAYIYIELHELLTLIKFNIIKLVF